MSFKRSAALQLPPPSLLDGLARFGLEDPWKGEIVCADERLKGASVGNVGVVNLLISITS